MPVLSHGRHIGWVATLRDRTEMLELQRELDLTRSTTDTLRAQAHEFSNRMHVVSGLIELGEYDDVRAYVQQIAADQTELSTQRHLPHRRPGRGRPAHREVQPGRPSAGSTSSSRRTTKLPRLDERLATDVNTVLGNLVDNALDAAAGAEDPFVAVEVVEA